MIIIGGLVCFAYRGVDNYDVDLAAARWSRSSSRSRKTSGKSAISSKASSAAFRSSG